MNTEEKKCAEPCCGVASPKPDFQKLATKFIWGNKPFADYIAEIWDQAYAQGVIEGTNRQAEANRQQILDLEAERNSWQSIAEDWRDWAYDLSDKHSKIRALCL
jgi:hypothetical protein